MRLWGFGKPDERAGYLTFEAKFTGLVQCYWRTNSTKAIDRASRALAELGRLEEGHVTVQQQATRFEGWVAKRDGFALRPRRLRELNPGYQVSVERRKRPDVAEALGSRRLASGFAVRAVGSVQLPPFAFGVADRRGNFCTLSGSHPIAEVDLEAFWPANGQEIPVSNHSDACTPLGFIDSVTQSPLASGMKRTWIPELVNRFPAEVFEAAQYSGDLTLAAVAAGHLTGTASNAEWADRFAMLAGEHPHRRRSDLVLLNVWRPTDTDGTGVVATPVPRPEGKRQGDAWVYRSGTDALPIPVQQWLGFENATIQDGGTVLADGRLIAYEASADPGLDFVSGQWESVYASTHQHDRALVRMREKSPRHIPEGVLLSGRNDDNWYHWMVEYLPRVFQIDSSVPASAPLIVSSRTPRSGIDALERFADRQIIVIDAAFAHDVGHLHLVAPPVQILDTTRVPWSEGLSMNASPLLEFRHRLGVDEPRLQGAGRRVFLHRASSRRSVLNQQNLADIADRLGLEIVDPSILSWSEQIDLFSSSSLVVGASGAVMANYLLMRPGSRVLALTSASLADFVLPAALAAVSQTSFGYLTGPNSTAIEDHVSRNSWLHSSFSVQPTLFERAVRREIASIGG